ncbi:hypothetical protein Tco_0686923 [Tanacetum coccineum]
MLRCWSTECEKRWRVVLIGFRTSSDLPLERCKDLGVIEGGSFDKFLYPSWSGFDGVTVLWAITGESELNGSNLVQETTNKIVVGYGWLKVSPWRVLAKVRGDSKRGPEFTWERKDQMRSKCPQLLVDTANASSS